MLDVLSVTFPIFAIIALGYGLTWRGWFRPSDIPVIGKFVLQVSLTALLIHTFASRDLGDVLIGGYLVAVGGGALATQLAVWIILRLQGIGPQRRAVGVMGTACSNSAFIVYPMLLIIDPAVAAPVLAMNFVVENLMGTPIGLTLLETARAREGTNPLLRVGQALLSVLKRPMVMGLIVGVVITLAGVPVPPAMDRFLSLLAAPAAPLALFFIGGTLIGMEMKGDVGLAAQIAGLKLFLHPVMIWLCLALPPLVGLGPLPPDLAFAALLTGALPMYSIYPILIQGTGYEGVASMALVFATIASFFTLSVFLFVFL